MAIGNGTPTTPGKTSRVTPTGEEPSAGGTRRSKRQPKPISNRFLDSPPKSSKAKASSGPGDGGPSSTSRPRRNLKRKNLAEEEFDFPENLLEASLASWGENEQANWPSWIEVESDPSIFTSILARLGIKEARVEEVFSLDQESLAHLPQPTHGLIFLYEYGAEQDNEDPATDHDIWFANQTTPNSCATIALLNICMNARQVLLGEKLRQLKRESAHLAPPLRGNLIANSSWVRTAHNSFSRRLDHLHSALHLSNNAEASKSAAKKRGSRRNKKESEPENAYHYIAFVPVGNRVWQIDGLMTGPVLVGQFDKDTPWTSVVGPVLESRMQQYETERLSFSLLALCGSPLAQLYRNLALAIRLADFIDERWGNDPMWKCPDDLLNADLPVLSRNPQTLEELGLDAEDMRALSCEAPEPASIQAQLGDLEIHDAMTAWRRVCNRQRQLLQEIETERGRQALEKNDILGRSRDYTPAIHKWLKMLAESGALWQLHQDITSAGNG